jgi:hypothetical protein
MQPRFNHTFQIKFVEIFVNDHKLNFAAAAPLP